MPPHLVLLVTVIEGHYRTLNDTAIRDIDKSRLICYNGTVFRYTDILEYQYPVLSLHPTFLYEVSV
jgi:hypothetical protein